MLKKLFLSLIISAISTGYALADDSIPAGVTVLHLQESAEEKVAQDRILAQMRLEKENYDVSRLQNSINKIMKDAVSKAKKNEEIEVNTGTYRVFKVYRGEKDKREEMWQGQQAISLEGSNKAEILELVADLQSLGFAQSNLSYTISPELHQKWRNTLMERAISNIQKRAQKVSDQLNLPNIRIAELNLQDHASNPKPYMVQRKMMSVAMESMEEPVLESSGEDIKITVRAKVYLKGE